MDYKYKRKDVQVRQLDGTYKRRSVRATTVKELNAKIKRIQEDAEREYQLSLCPYFNDVADAWNEKHEKEIAYNTWSGYQSPLKDLKAEFNGLRITEITPLMLQNILDAMNAQGYAKQTINLRKVTASLIFNYAVIQGYVEHSPCTHLKVPKNAPQTKRQAPTAADIEKMLNAKGAFADFARFLYFTGCRRSEALALTKDDIKDGYIHINKTLYWVGELPHIKDTPKTSAGVRSVPILAPIKMFLSNNKQSILFKGENGYMRRSEFLKGWAKWQKENDIHLTAHQLRHGFATICYEAELNEKDTADIMGHSSVDVTRDIYTHISMERQKQTTEKLNVFLTQGG